MAEVAGAPEINVVTQEKAIPPMERLTFPRGISRAVESIASELGRIDEREFDAASKELLYKGAAVKEVKKASGYYLNEKINFGDSDVKEGLQRYLDEGISSGKDKDELYSNVDRVVGPLLEATPQSQQYKDGDQLQRFIQEVKGGKVEETPVATPATTEQDQTTQNEQADKAKLRKSLWNVLLGRK